MECKVAKTAGFCFGVKKAVNIVNTQVDENKGEKIYTYGPIIHNDEVIKDMRKKGVQVLNIRAELENLDSGIVIIRSHGVSKEIYDLMEKRGIKYVDATCPFVKKIHRIVQKESDLNKVIIIIGNKTHPEVVGIMGWSSMPVYVVQSIEEANNLVINSNEKICIVSQTTFNYNKFKELVEIISKKSYDVSVLNTICSATKERQTEAEQIARTVDAMIVIGDKHSSNTQKLFEICKNACNNTYYIQTLDDLNMNQLESVETVGITAGASTPNNIIEEVQINVRINF